MISFVAELFAIGDKNQSTNNNTATSQLHIQRLILKTQRKHLHFHIVGWKRSNHRYFILTPQQLQLLAIVVEHYPHVEYHLLRNILNQQLDVKYRA